MGTQMTLRELPAAVPGMYLLTAGGEILVGIGTMDRAVEWLGANGQRISGLEGFTTDGTHLDPLLANIADLSEAVDSPARDLAERALAVTRDWGSQVEFVAISIVSN